VIGRRIGARREEGYDAAHPRAALRQGRIAGNAD
jgi:hypothetical protein